MEDLREFFNSLTGFESFKRVDDVQPLDLYIGVDELSHWTLLLICDKKPQYPPSSKMIQAQLSQRKDGKWVVSLSLLKNEFSDMFILFCGDIIESSRIIKDKDKAALFVVNRYKEWREMLANTRIDLLSPEEIKGLLGELYFLDSELILKYGSEKSALSWTGPKAAHQDFILDDTWYEVKTISSGKDEIRISSVEQLDCQNDGKLIVVTIEKTSKTNKKATNLNAVYKKVLSQIDNDEVKAEFCDMLFEYGYFPRPEYEDLDYIFEIKGIKHYLVTDSFPCFRRKSIPSDITKVDYSISLPAIIDYLED